VGHAELSRCRANDDFRERADGCRYSPGVHPLLAFRRNGSGCGTRHLVDHRARFRPPRTWRAVAVGILSHLVLDLATHAPDIALWPGSPFPKLGLGLYSGAPAVAFVVELLYGVLCWWVYRGRKGLLVVLLVGNLANTSFFFASIAGPEELLAGHPLLVVTAVFVQIVTMLVLVAMMSSKRALTTK
jgi:hypothetical protein